MLHDDAQRRLLRGGGGRVVARAALRDVGQEGGEDIGLVERGRVLQHHRPAFQAGAGVDVLAGQGRARSVGALQELHEDEVPDLQVAILFGGGAGVGSVGAQVVVDLGAGTAGPVEAGEPVVALILAVAIDAILGHADLAPVRVRIVVVEEDGRDEPLLGHAHDLGDELPGPGLGLGLEVVAQGEVAHHLEEGEMRLVADLVDVGGAEALLRGREPGPRRSRLAQEVRLEGDHAGAGEEQGGIARRDERGAGDGLMAALLEEVAEGASDAVGFHAGVLRSAALRAATADWRCPMSHGKYTNGGVPALSPRTGACGGRVWQARAACPSAHARHDRGTGGG